MGNILRRLFKGDGEDHHDHDGGSDQYPYYRPTSRYGIFYAGEDQPAAASPTRWRPRHDQQALGPHGARPATVGVADILNFEAKSTGILASYNLPIPSLPAASASSGHHPSSLPEGVKFVMNTLPVNNKCIGDGDGFNPYVNTTDPRESANVPLKVHEMVIARTKARAHKDYQRADALLSSIEEAGYKIITISGEEILTRKYRIRMRGIDAPELDMPYGEESKNALVKLIGGRSVTIYVYDQDQFGRYVGDIYCDNVFIQEQMLKSGHVWHFKNYDQRPEFAKWEREARAAHRGLWASDSPEKPWDWRRKQRRAGHDAIQVY